VDVGMDVDMDMVMVMVVVVIMVVVVVVSRITKEEPMVKPIDPAWICCKGSISVDPMRNCNNLSSSSLEN
jgi:hypothetical protein